MISDCHKQILYLEAYIRWQNVEFEETPVVSELAERTEREHERSLV